MPIPVNGESREFGISRKTGYKIFNIEAAVNQVRNQVKLGAVLCE